MNLSEIVQQIATLAKRDSPCSGNRRRACHKFPVLAGERRAGGLVDALRVKMREERASFIRARMEPMKHLTETVALTWKNDG